MSSNAKKIHLEGFNEELPLRVRERARWTNNENSTEANVDSESIRLDQKDPHHVADLPILDNEYATLWYHSDSRIVHHEIKQFISGQPLRSLLDEGFKALVRHRATKWLSDDRNCSTMLVDDEIWAKDVWLCVQGGDTGRWSNR